MNELCTVCGETLDNGEPIQRDLDGTGAHVECLDAVLHPEEGDEE